MLCNVIDPVLSCENSVPACDVDAENTDIYVIAAKASHEILAPLLIYRKGKYHYCKQLCSNEIQQYIIQINIGLRLCQCSHFTVMGKTIIKKSHSIAADWQ